MNKAKKYILTVLIVSTFFNLGFLIIKKNIEVEKLINENHLINKQNERYKKSIELSFSEKVMLMPDTIKQGSVIYFPNDACSKCLEDVLLILENELNIKANFIIYFDNPNRVGIVENFNEMYGTNHKCVIGKSIFYQEQTNIVLLKINAGHVIGTFLLDAKKKEDFISQLTEYKTFFKDKNLSNVSGMQ